MTRLSPARPLLVPLIFVFAAACASGGGAAGGGGSSALSYGYMVPGSSVATALSISATDTLPEIASQSSVPTAVTTAISREVATGNWNNRCIRRFGGPTTFAVIFHRSCDPSQGPEAEPQVIVGFAADGRAIGRVRWSGATTVTTLVPARRF